MNAKTWLIRRYCRLFGHDIAVERLGSKVFPVPVYCMRCGLKGNAYPEVRDDL